MDLNDLIHKGEELKSENYDSPRIDMWQDDVKAAVSEYGESSLKTLERAMFFGYAIRSNEGGNKMSREMIDKVIVILEELKKRDSASMQAQSQILNQKTQEARATLGAKFGTTNFNGDVTFGDNSPINNIQVGEIMLAIISEAEAKLPDGDEKSKILSALKNITSNPTFAALAGASLPDIIKQLMNK